jgi:hypothetical protein
VATWIGESLLSELLPLSKCLVDLAGSHLAVLNRDYRGKHSSGDTLYVVQGWIMGRAERGRDPDFGGPPTRHRPFVGQPCRHCGTVRRIPSTGRPARCGGTGRQAARPARARPAAAARSAVVLIQYGSTRQCANREQRTGNWELGTGNWVASDEALQARRPLGAYRLCPGMTRPTLVDCYSVGYSATLV